MKSQSTFSATMQCFILRSERVHFCKNIHSEVLCHSIIIHLSLYVIQQGRPFHLYPGLFILNCRGTYIHNNPVCVCVYVRKTPEAGSLVVLSTRQCHLLLNKYGLSMSLLGNSTLGQAHTHTHTHRVIVYICPPINSMTTCRPAPVLILIYVRL